MDGHVSKPIKAEGLFAEIEKLGTESQGNEKKILFSSQNNEQTAADVFDLPEALQMVDGDMQLLEELIELFLEDLPDHIAQIRDGIAQRNATSVEHVAHSLKGSVGNFCAKRAFEAAYRLELMGREGKSEEADRALSELEQELGQLEVALRSVFQGEIGNEGLNCRG